VNSASLLHCSGRPELRRASEDCHWVRQLQDYFAKRRPGVAPDSWTGMLPEGGTGETRRLVSAAAVQTRAWMMTTLSRTAVVSSGALSPQWGNARAPYLWVA